MTGNDQLLAVIDADDPNGVLCMLATGFAFYWDWRNDGNAYDRDGAVSAVENALRRHWLPADWADKVSVDAVSRNLDTIMSLIPAVLDVGDGDGRPRVAWEHVLALCETGASTVTPPELPAQPEWVNQCKPHFGRMLRHWYLYRLHMVNHRYDPNIDWRHMVEFLANTVRIANKPRPAVQYDEEHVEAVVRLAPKFINPHSSGVTWERMKALL